MGRNDPLFVYVGVFDDQTEADGAYEDVKELRRDGVIGSYDAAVVVKQNGSVKVHKHEKPTQHGAWTGLVAGGVVGLLVPPVLIGGAVLAAGGAAAGGVIGHLWRGMSRGDLKELGEQLDQGEAALVVVAKDKVDKQLDKANRKARRAAQKELHVDLEEFQKDVESAYAEATGP